MALGDWLIVAGLGIDIGGIALLFVTTTYKKFEVEFAYEENKMLYPSVAPGMDDAEAASLAAHIEEQKRRISKNRRLQTVALVAVVVGFGLQIAGQVATSG